MLRLYVLWATLTNKFSAPSLESYEFPVNPRNLETLITRREQFDNGLESDMISAMRETLAYSRSSGDTLSQVSSASKWLNW